ncbi:MAG: ABC transporter permease [Alphaproteobacteria bacterium]|nr:ABC transporter permease [Alphaproteobacteria bacterium]
MSANGSTSRAARLGEIGWRLLVPAGLIALWYVFTEIVPLFHHVMLPSPLAVIRMLQRLVSNGELARHIVASLERILYANLGALALGVPLGLAMGLYRPIDRLLDGIISMFRPIPPLAWVPLSILWLGIGTLSVVFITFLAAFFAVLINTIAGARSVERLHVRAALSLGVSRRRMMTHVVMPSVAPYIFTGFRIAIGVSWMSIVAAELIAASSGLGYMITYYREVLRTDAIIVGMLTIGIIGLLMDILTRRIEQWLMPWRQGLHLS